MNKFWILLAVALAGVLHLVLVEEAYYEGYQDAEKALGTTAEQCFHYWFGDTKRYEQELRAFCKRGGV
jgi:hypothetical protein